MTATFSGVAGETHGDASTVNALAAAVTELAQYPLELTSTALEDLTRLTGLTHRMHVDGSTDGLVQHLATSVGTTLLAVRSRTLDRTLSAAQADVLLSRLHLCLPGWRAAEGRRRRAEQQFEWQEAARARGLAWDERGTDSSDFDEPQGAHRHH